MGIPNVGGGRQYGDGNENETVLITQAAPKTATSTATLTAAQILGGILLGSPSSSAATYTLPTVALLEASLTNATAANKAFDLSIQNVDGSGSGVITVAAGTGWTISGLATIAATAGTGSMWRARKTGDGAWTLYRLA